MESNKHEETITFEPGKVYFFICFALVSGGKTTFYDYIRNNDEIKEKYNLYYVSSDQLRNQLAEEYHMEHNELSLQECFDKVGIKTAKLFDKKIKDFIHKKSHDKPNIVLVDKNYPNGIDKFWNLFCKDTDNTKIIAFIPQMSKHIKFKDNNDSDSNNNEKVKFIRYPYSFDYIVQCYLRLLHRTGHENLNGENDNAGFVFISFLRLFQNFNFNYIAKGRTNVITKQIMFSDETKNVSFGEEEEMFFRDVLVPMKPFDFLLIKDKYQDRIDTFLKSIIEKYDKGGFFNNTIEDIQNEIKNLLL